jgi:transposase
MAREKRDVWIKRVERWRGSGLSAREFGAEVGIDSKALLRWSWRLRSEQRRAAQTSAAPSIPAPEWVEVTARPVESQSTPTVTSLFELVLPTGVTVRVPPGFSSDALKRLLETVGR